MVNRPWYAVNRESSSAGADSAPQGNDTGKPMNKSAAIIFIACLAGFSALPAGADTLVLFEGSTLTGKIISDDGSWVILRNYHGTFRIKRSRIDDIYPTGSHREDIDLHRRLNLPHNEEEIRLNYLAGQGRIAAKLKEETPAETADITPIDESTGPVEKKPWTSGRISFSGSFLNRSGGGSSTLRDGYAFNVALDQGLDFLAGGPHLLIPGLRLEGSHIYFRKASRSLTGFTAAAGPMWAFPSMKNRGGCFIIALMPGVSILRAGTHSPFAGRFVRCGGTRFAGQAIAGYQKSFGPMSFFILGRYLHIPGNKKGLMAAGAEAGIGINAW